MSGDWLSSTIPTNGYGNTYIKGFLDVSGGNVLLRNGNLIITSSQSSSINGRLLVSSDISALNLYTTGNIGVPALQVGKPANSLTPVSSYAFDVSGKSQIANTNTIPINCPSTFLTINQSVNASIINQYDSTIAASQTIAPSTFDWYSDVFASYIYSNYSIYNPVITFYPNTYNNKNIYYPPSFLADSSCAGRFGITDAATYNGNVYINGGQYISTSDISLNGRLISTTGDASLNGRLYVGGDASLNGRLFLGGDASGQGNLYANDASFNKTLFVGSDAFLNGRIFVKTDVSINGNLAIAKDLSYGGSASFPNLTINVSAFNLSGYSTKFMDTSTNQIVDGKKTFGGLITCSYDVSMVSGNLYVSGQTKGTEAKVAGRAFIGKDAQINGQVNINKSLKVNIKTQGQGFVLDTSSANTNGYGAAHIYESITGTLPTASGGTLVIQHADISGASSIVFPSTTNYGKDYGSVAYYDSVYEVPKYNYFNTTSSSALVINAQSDGIEDLNTTDAVILQAAGSVIIDTSQTIIQVKGGSVGIGKTNPTYALDVSGVFSSTQILQTSDYRIKQNVEPLIDQSKYSVDNLRPFMYTNTLANKEDIGFLAHELQEEYPFLVLGEKDASDNYQSINYVGIIAILVAEVKRLRGVTEVKRLRDEAK